MRFARLAPLILLLGACATPEPKVAPTATAPEDKPVKKAERIESQPLKYLVGAT